MVHDCRRTFSPRRMEEESRRSARAPRRRPCRSNLRKQISKETTCIRDEKHILTPEREAAEAALPLAYGEIPEAPESDDDGSSYARRLPHRQPAPIPRWLEKRSDAEDAAEDGDAAAKMLPRRRRLPTQAFAESIEAQARRPPAPEHFADHGTASGFVRAARIRSAPIFEAPRARARCRSAAPAPQLPSERTAHGRAGDPALASRMAQLESMLRRLVSSPLHRLDEADHAPAGPGVFLLSDSDQITSYYVEACQTLRVGLGNLARGNRGRKTSAAAAAAIPSPA